MYTVKMLECVAFDQVINKYLWDIILSPQYYVASDVNECAEGIDACAHVCTDTSTGYTCSCNSGYRLASDGHRCNGK